MQKRDPQPVHMFSSILFFLFFHVYCNNLTHTGDLFFSGSPLLQVPGRKPLAYFFANYKKLEAVMAKKQIHTLTTFEGETWLAENDRGTKISIGPGPEKAAPYELLFAALSGCLYDTFASVAEKTKVVLPPVEFDISGEKRDADVATLETCLIKVTVKGAVDEKRVTKAFETATRYCSIFQTLSQVATMQWSLTIQA